MTPRRQSAKHPGHEPSLLISSHRSMESWEVEVGLVQGLGVMYMLTEPDFGGGSRTMNHLCIEISQLVLHSFNLSVGQIPRVAIATSLDFVRRSRSFCLWGGEVSCFSLFHSPESL